MRLGLVFCLALLATTALPAASSISTAEAANCQFQLGFKTLRDMIPNVVGDCLVDEHHDPVNGDGLQETTAWHGKGGLLVWRKADNWTAFTDGAKTWINGPRGLQSRPNADRFDWERDRPAVAPTATPSISLSTSLEATCSATATALSHAYARYFGSSSDVYWFFRNGCRTRAAQSGAVGARCYLDAWVLAWYHNHYLAMTPEELLRDAEDLYSECLADPRSFPR